MKQETFSPATLQNYANEEAMLVRRQTHDLFTFPALDFARWVLECFQWQGHERVLDVGSGAAYYLKALLDYIPVQQYTALDISANLLHNARKHGAEALVQADAHELPFPNQSFDLVLANHLLYYLPGLDEAIEEMHRLLKPGGVLLAATSSHATMPEIDTLIQRAFRLLGQPLPGENGPEQLFLQRFSLETGTYHLARHFQAVARYDLPSTLIFSTPEPLIRYINSLRVFYEPHMPPGIVWDDFIVIMSDQVRRLVTHFGELVVNKLSGVIVATDSGGFATRYIQLLEAEAAR